MTILLFLFIVNIDDCWQRSRDAQGTIQPDPITFPSGGIPALIDYVHSKKLKFGLYSGIKIIFIHPLIIFLLFFFDTKDSGNQTCQRRPGSLGYEQKMPILMLLGV